MTTRPGTLAKIARQKKALSRFAKAGRNDCRPNTNIPRFRTEDEFEIYLVRKHREQASLMVRVKASV